MKTAGIRLTLVVVWLASLAAAFYLGDRWRDGGAAAGPSWELASKSQSLLSSGGAGVVPGGVPSAGGREAISRPKINDLPVLIGNIRTEFDGGTAITANLPAILKVMAPLAGLTADQLGKALIEVEATVNVPQQQTMLYSALLGQLAEVDGPGAMAFFEDNLLGERTHLRGVRTAILKSWAGRDPDAAWEWYQENPESGANDGQVAAIFSGMVLRDPDAAFDRIGRLSGKAKDQALSAMAAAGARDPEMRVRILARAESLAGESRGMFHRRLIGPWALNDPDSAVDWLSNLSPEERAPLVTQAGSMLMVTDPRRGAEFLLENAPKDRLATTYSQIMGQWARRDPNAAGEWLNQQPQGADLDAARVSFSANAVRLDPFSAMEWAKTVEDPARRLNAVQQVYQRWRAMDSQAAETALERSRLAPEQIQSLRDQTNGPAAGSRAAGIPFRR